MNEIVEQEPGRPQKLTSRDNQAIVRLMLSGGNKTAIEIA